MSSTVQIPFTSFIRIERNSETPVYLQLVFEFIKAIQLGFLPQGTKLPGTRVLCQLLAVHKNTLVKALHDLEAQGFLEIIPSVGVVILPYQSQNAKAIHVESTLTSGFSFRQSSILDNPKEYSNLVLQMDNGLPDIRLTHTHILSKRYISKLGEQFYRKNFLAYQQRIHQDFKEQFLNYLNLTRSLRLRENGLLTFSSHEMALYMVLKLLVSEGDRVVVASPGYYAAHMALADRGAKIISIPVTEEGLDIERLERICLTASIRMLYITSSYQYPTTIKLSAKCRVELLRLADQYGFVILEDDYEFDFHHLTEPVLPLAAFNSNAHVVYVGSLFESLPIGFRYGFVAGPPAFIAELEKHKLLTDASIDVFKEQVLTPWIKEGEVHRLAKKNKQLYRQRRDYFIKLMQEVFSEHIQIQTPERGLAIWVEWKLNFNLAEFKRQCAKNGLFIPLNLLFQNKDVRAMRLGFGSLTELEMGEVVRKLAHAYEKIIGKKAFFIKLGPPLKVHMSLIIERTDPQNEAYRKLILHLDAHLSVKNGETDAFFAQFNQSDDIHHVIVVYDEGRPIAIGAFKVYDGSTVEIKRMYVLPELRGKGVASRVLVSLENWALELGYSVSVLETGTNMDDAIALYEKNGYLVTENYAQYVGIENSKCFRKSLI